MQTLIEALTDIAQNRGNSCSNRMLCAERAARALREYQKTTTPTDGESSLKTILMLADHAEHSPRPSDRELEL